MWIFQIIKPKIISPDGGEWGSKNVSQSSSTSTKGVTGRLSLDLNMSIGPKAVEERLGHFPPGLRWALNTQKLTGRQLSDIMTLTDKLHNELGFYPDAPNAGMFLEKLAEEIKEENRPSFWNLIINYSGFLCNMADSMPLSAFIQGMLDSQKKNKSEFSEVGIRRIAKSNRRDEFSLLLNELVADSKNKNFLVKIAPDFALTVAKLAPMNFHTLYRAAVGRTEYVFTSGQSKEKFDEKLNDESIPKEIRTDMAKIQPEDMALILKLQTGESLNLTLDGRPYRFKMNQNSLDIYKGYSDYTSFIADEYVSGSLAPIFAKFVQTPSEPDLHAKQRLVETLMDLKVVSLLMEHSEVFSSISFSSAGAESAALRLLVEMSKVSKDPKQVDNAILTIHLMMKAVDKKARRVDQFAQTEGVDFPTLSKPSESLMMRMMDKRFVSELIQRFPSQLVNLCRKQGTDADFMMNNLIVLIARITEIPAIQGRVGESEIPKIIDEACKSTVPPSAFFALYATESVLSLSVDKRAGKISEMYETFKKQGVRYFHRYSPELLDNVYRTATEPDYRPPGGLHSDGRIVFIAFNQNDHDNFFEHQSQILDKYLKEGYRIVLCEDNTDKKIAQRWFNFGRLESDPAPVHLVQHGGYDSWVFAGHGTPESIKFGGSESILGIDQKFELDVGDKKRKIFRSMPWSDMIVSKEESRGLIIACEGGGKSKAGNFHSIMSVIGQETRCITFASKISMSATDVIFDKNGWLSNAIYDDNTANTNVYIPPELKGQGFVYSNSTGLVQKAGKIAKK